MFYCVVLHKICNLILLLLRNMRKAILVTLLFTGILCSFGSVKPENLVDRERIIFREDLPENRVMIDEKKFNQLKDDLTAISNVSYYN